VPQPDELDAHGQQPYEEGEYARAEAFLTLVYGHLLQAVRLVEEKSANWLSPSRRLEEDVSAASYERFRACTAALNAEQLVRAYTSPWEWSQKLMCELATSHAFVLPEALLNKLDQHIEVDKVPKPNFREPAVEPMGLVRMNEEDARQR
jgi:hypothetical protein